MNKREKPVFWKWSVDEPYYRSAPRQQQQQLEKVIDSDPVYDSQQNAINQSLEFETTSNSNTREEIDDKMAGRELVLQRGANPFMQQTSYVNDIVVRDMFLKPINTTQGRNKPIESAEPSASSSLF